MHLTTDEKAFSDTLKPDKEYEISDGKLVRIGTSGSCVSRRVLSNQEKETVRKLPMPKRFGRDSFNKVCDDSFHKKLETIRGWQ